MSQASFAYAAPANDHGSVPARLPVGLSIYADRPHIRGQFCDDLESAGFRVAEAAPVAALLDGLARPLGEVVMLDCPELDGGKLAALAQLDMRVARSGAQLVVSTSLDALEYVFACLDQCDPQILVDPTRAERVIALGHALARLPSGRVRELSEDDRLMLLRLTEQVGQIASRLDHLDRSQGSGDSAFRFESPGLAFAGGQAGAAAVDGTDRLVRAARPPLPDPRLVRRILRQRQMRARYFDGDLFADPAWDMLLDLTAARAEHNRVSVTSLCIASGVPPTTALRWITQLTEAGLFQRVEDETDRRRAFIALTDRAADAMSRYFADLGNSAGRLV